MNSANLIPIALVLISVGCSVAHEAQTPAAPAPQATSGFYALDAADIDGHPQALSKYAGQVTLVVNTASKCGYTPQYEGLQKLHSELSARGFTILGFPSNDFGAQEPGTAEDIKTFCTDNYHVTFPMFSKVITKAGAGQSPIYEQLGRDTGKLPSWNFCKYLIGKDGHVIGFYPSKVKPDDAELRQAIEAALAAK